MKHLAKKHIHILFLSVFCVLLPSLANSEVITKDTIWQGVVILEEDCLIPKGVTVTVLPGTEIKVVPSDSTKTDPEYMSPFTEITVRGILKVHGESNAPVRFQFKRLEQLHTWAGIIVDGGTVDLKHVSITNADVGVHVFAGNAMLNHTSITNNKYGIIQHNRNAKVDIATSVIQQNEYGILQLRGSMVSVHNSVVTGNTKKDIHASIEKKEIILNEPAVPNKPVARKYNDMVLLGDTVWQGRIQIDGLIRLPPENRLIILPGTIIEIVKSDENNDNIGENGLLLQGVLIAKGTRENPIIFRSAEKEKNMGDWDAINIINSDGAQNLIEYCVFQDAYRGLHFHFSNVTVRNSVFINNYRGIQFQESSVDLRNNLFHNNKSGIQARDSEIGFMNNHLYANYFGANFFRARLTIIKNVFQDNLDFGLKVREGFPTLKNNTISGNRFGLMMHDANFGEVLKNILVNNVEAGISLRSTDNVYIKGNYITDNGLSGIKITDSRAEITGNTVAENGLRGVGIREFYGRISNNSIIQTQGFAIENEGKSNVDAQNNWFGSPAHNIDPIIFDNHDDANVGRVNVSQVSSYPILYTWPLTNLPVSLTWHGDIIVSNNVEVSRNNELTVAPGTKVQFAPQTGMHVLSRIKAIGTHENRILFTGVDTENRWDEIKLEYALGSVFSNMDFENANWAIHCHFTDLVIENCTFKNNYGGMRFRSGPVTIKNSIFSKNIIGVRSYLGVANIEKSIFTENEKGIFVREKGSGLTIRQNNFFANLDYNIRIGEFNTEDVDARNNWWGTNEPQETFFDANREPGIGFVIYKPFLTEPVVMDLQLR